MAQTLQDRLAEVMNAKQWRHADLMSITGQSSSVVSQWLGKGTKIIKTIGKLEAAQAIEAASGYSALWVAKGLGPKFTPLAARATIGYAAAEQPPEYLALRGQTPRSRVLSLGNALPPSSPQKLKWEDLMHTTPREVFALELQDDAMAPDFPAGTIMRLDPSKAPRAGWPALVRDAHGHHYLRD